MSDLGSWFPEKFSPLEKDEQVQEIVTAETDATYWQRLWPLVIRTGKVLACTLAGRKP